MRHLVQLSPLMLLGAPLTEPPEPFRGDDGEGLLDLSWSHPDHGMQGKGLWPIVASDPPHDPATETPTDDLSNLAPDLASRTVTATRGKRALTPQEIAARRPPARTAQRGYLVLALHRLGKLAAVEAAVAAAGPEAALLWASATLFSEADPEIAAIAAVPSVSIDVAELFDLCDEIAADRRAARAAP